MKNMKAVTLILLLSFFPACLTFRMAKRLDYSPPMNLSYAVIPGENSIYLANLANQIKTDFRLAGLEVSDSPVTATILVIVTAKSHTQNTVVPIYTKNTTTGWVGNIPVTTTSNTLNYVPSSYTTLITSVSFYDMGEAQRNFQSDKKVLPISVWEMVMGGADSKDVSRYLLKFMWKDHLSQNDKSASE